MKFVPGQEYTGAQLTESGLEFFRLTNRYEIHNGFPYKTGLNKDRLPFNPSGKCRSGGLYFFSEKQLVNFHLNVAYYNVVWIRKVTFPDDARVYAEKGKFKADKFILGERSEIPREMWVEAVRQDADMLRYTPKEIRDYDIRLAAVQRNGWALECVPESARDHDMCLEAVKSNGQALVLVPWKLRTRDMCLTAVQNDGHALLYVPHDLKDRDLCLTAVRQDGEALIHVPKELRDRDICLTAVQQNGHALYYVPKEIKDRDICLTAVQQERWMLECYVPDELKDEIIHALTTAK